MNDTLSADITYDSDGKPTRLSVFTQDHKLAYVDIVGGSAVVKKMYPQDARNYVTGEECAVVLNYLESLPMVQAIQFGEVDE